MVSEKVQKLVDDTLKYCIPFLDVISQTKQLSVDELNEYFNNIQDNHPDLLESMNQYTSVMPNPSFPVIMYPGFSPISNDEDLTPEFTEKILGKVHEVLGNKPMQKIVEEIRQDPKYADFKLDQDPALAMRLLMPKLLKATVENKELSDVFIDGMMNSKTMSQGLNDITRALKKDKMIDDLLPPPPMSPSIENKDQQQQQGK